MQESESEENGIFFLRLYFSGFSFSRLRSLSLRLLFWSIQFMCRIDKNTQCAVFIFRQCGFLSLSLSPFIRFIFIFISFIHIYTAPIYVCGVSVFVTRGLRSRSRLSLGYIICSTDTWNCLANVLSEKSRRRLYKIQQIYVHSKQYIFRMPDRHQHVILLSLSFFHFHFCVH